MKKHVLGRTYAEWADIHRSTARRYLRLTQILGELTARLDGASHAESTGDLLTELANCHDFLARVLREQAKGH